MADEFFFLATSMVFGSNASASSWEPFQRAIQALIPMLSMRDDLVEQHKHLLDMLKWDDDEMHFFPVERVKWNDYNKTFYYIFYAVGNIVEPT